LRRPPRSPLFPYTTLFRSCLAHREQPGDGCLSRRINADAAVARVMVQLHLDQVSPHVDALRPHELDEQLGEKAPLGAGQVEEHAVVCRGATGEDLTLDCAVQVQSGIATAYGPVKRLE